MAGTTNIKRAAQLRGVSLGTVSNVLNQPERVTEATHERVLDAIADQAELITVDTPSLTVASGRAAAAHLADIAIVGYDDIEFAAAAAVPLSSVRQPREHLGRTAALLLLEETEANSHHQHRHVVFQPELVIRESSNQPARVRRAIVKARRG